MAKKQTNSQELRDEAAQKKACEGTIEEYISGSWIERVY